MKILATMKIFKNFIKSKTFSRFEFFFDRDKQGGGTKPSYMEVTQKSSGAVMEHTIMFSKKTEKDIKMIVDEFGFNSEEEFVKEAFAEKILKLKKLIFFNITNQIGAALRSKGMTVKQILKEVEEARE